MSTAQILALPATGVHDSRREGVRLGLIIATVTWLWVAVIDVITGHPFHTFTALGGVIAFTAMHYLLNLTYGIVLLATVHGAERAPSLVIALMFGLITFEGGIAMMTNLLAQASLGRIAWIGLFGGSLISTGLALVLLSRTHPLAAHLKRAEDET